ncbi:tubulin-specific chaperone cofactor E-like protein isoform X2 [Centruroides sculpturatus]|uniref:tubulin-specific chaperone cofactor E-like protein isoform X2 n=1 Tax=Centruroides sculpturatus TaxID=218467 RepID=UPI000C6DCAE1|nr:tubulin-specific chaperone cofactor E-like protein isoform X2 [Centruroides sculpturatus]
MPCCSFTDALYAKYGEEMEDKGCNPCEIFVVGSAPGRSSPSGRLIIPRALTLNCCGIENAGSQRTIEELCHDVEELDLAQNQLNDLKENSSAHLIHLTCFLIFG